jgi:hypothetical protein
MTLACSLFVWLNNLETITEEEPQYAPLVGALPHPPPYDLQEMAVTFHRDRGWPIWHSRATNHFRAHNAALYYLSGPPLGPQLDWETDYRRLAVNAFVGFVVVALVGTVSELFVCGVLKWKGQGPRGCEPS